MKRTISPIVRVPSLAIAHAALRPMLWGFNRSPLARPFYDLVGRRMNLVRTHGGSFEAYRPDARDVVVCSYGKSGTNWALQMVQQIAHRGAAEFEHIHDVVPWPDAPARGYALPLAADGARAMMRPIKTHLPWDCVPYTAEAKYLCVVRNPKDVVVSGYYFFRSVILGPLMPPLDLWVDHFLTHEHFLGSWPHHLKSYWQERHRPNVLFMTFEEMKADLPSAIDRIAGLMGVALSPEERAEVIARSDFGYMKRIDHKFYPGLVSPLGARNGEMMRQGKSHAAHTVLSAAQRERIDASCKGELARLGCDFPYDEVFVK